MNIQKENKLNEIVARISTEDVLKRTEGAVLDLIATKLADKYVQEHGDYLLHNIIDITTLKEEVASLIKARLTNETENRVQK